MSFKARLRRTLARSDDRVAIPLEDGGVELCTPEELQEAFLINVRRIAGENIEAHPASVAAARSSDPWWRKSAWGHTPVHRDVEDLSE